MIARGTTAVAALIVISGCAAGPSPSPDLRQIVATLEPSADVYIERIDDTFGSRGAVERRLDLAPGSHTIVVHRRTEMPAGGPRHLPDAAVRIGSDALGRAAYVSEWNCSLTFDAQSGARYELRTELAGAGPGWIGRLSGPGTDVSCTPTDPVTTELVGQMRYLCCTIAFSDGVATDANYRYGPDAVRLPAGLPVEVIAAERNHVTLRNHADGETYDLYFEYGRLQIDGRTFFHRILLDHDPTAMLRSAKAGIAEAVASSEILPGMTPAQVIMARGYPPLHQTPDLEAPKWLYYIGPGRGEYVDFSDGKVDSVLKFPAP